MKAYIHLSARDILSDLILSIITINCWFTSLQQTLYLKHNIHAFIQYWPMCGHYWWRLFT